MDTNIVSFAARGIHAALEQIVAMAHAQHFGDPLDGLLHHAQHMLDILEEELRGCQGNDECDSLRGLTHAIRAKISEAQSLLKHTMH